MFPPLDHNSFVRKVLGPRSTLCRVPLRPCVYCYIKYSAGSQCVCVFIPSPVRVGTLLMEVPGTPIGASFFEFELKPTGKDSADPTQHEFQHHIL